MKSILTSQSLSIRDVCGTGAVCPSVLRIELTDPQQTSHPLVPLTPSPIHRELVTAEQRGQRYNPVPLRLR